MGQKYMWQKLKSLGAFLLILFLLPYVVTVFIHGAEIDVSGKNNGFYVKVKESAESGEQSVTELPWEEYFIGVLACEVPQECEMEFLKAQAVLIRTKMYQVLNAPEGDKILTERYLKLKDLEKKMGSEDFEAYYQKLKNAVKETENLVLLYQGAYAYAPFHQSSNGSTRSGSEVLGTDTYPYLQVRECPLDKGAQDEMQTMVLEYREVQKKCQPFLVAVAKSEAGKTYTFSDFEILAHDSAGYVSQFRIGDTICTGDQVRDALSLSSSAFSIKDANGRLSITTMGKGHGLGMSQWTANEMAKEGKSFGEILCYFFEGTTLADGGEIFVKAE